MLWRFIPNKSDFVNKKNTLTLAACDLNTAFTYISMVLFASHFKAYSLPVLRYDQSPSNTLWVTFEQPPPPSSLSLSASLLSISTSPAEIPACAFTFLETRGGGRGQKPRAVRRKRVIIFSAWFAFREKPLLSLCATVCAELARSTRGPAVTERGVAGEAREDEHNGLRTQTI